ncbi:MAG: hypothetical protein LH629_15595, partial [Ignavibacteria bacterium]|nr:hypothetical protein [Ignavibacteria bacterium]
MTSGIPIVFFYISSYNYEQNIGIRYRQLQYGNQLPGKLNNMKIDSIRKFNTIGRKFYYYDGFFIKNIALTKPQKHASYSDEDGITASILGLFRINFTDVAVSEEKFYTSHATDSAFFYNQLLKDACKSNNSTISYFQTPEHQTYLTLTASPFNYRFPPFMDRNGIIFWLLFLMALIIFYFIINNIINKLFCLRLPDTTVWKSLDDMLFKNKDLNKLVFVIGLPGSGKLAQIKKKIEKKEIFHEEEELTYSEINPELNNVFVADLINIPDVGTENERNEKFRFFTNEVFLSKHKLIIVNHFEYNIQDEITNSIKLNFLERIMLKNKAKIIILSTIHPVAFLDSVIDHTKETEEKSVPGHDLERWHVLLGHYRIVVFAIEVSKDIKV